MFSSSVWNKCCALLVATTSLWISWWLVASKARLTRLFTSIDAVQLIVNDKCDGLGMWPPPPFNRVIVPLSHPPVTEARVRGGNDLWGMFRSCDQSPQQAGRWASHRSYVRLLLFFTHRVYTQDYLWGRCSPQTPPRLHWPLTTCDISLKSQTCLKVFILFSCRRCE